MSKDFSSEEESTLLRMMQAVAVPVLGNVCHVFMNGLNRVQVCHDSFYAVEFPYLGFLLPLLFDFLSDWNCCMEEQVYGLEKLHAALLQRPKGKPLLTVRVLDSESLRNYIVWV